MTTDMTDDFALSQQDYAEVLGTAPHDSTQSDTSDGCTDENVVVIWEWLPAIQCWLKHLFDTKWESGEGDSSFDWSPYLSISW